MWKKNDPEPSRPRTAPDTCPQTVRGVRLTRLRRQVLDVLLQAAKPVKAYAIMDALRHDAAKPITPASIYRSLDFLQSHGLVHRVGALNAFVACTHVCENEHTPVFMLVCGNCRQSREVGNPALYAMLAAALREQGFCLQDGAIELGGLCPDCGGCNGSP